MKSGAAKSDLANEMRVLSDQIYSAANKLMALHQSDPAMITQLPVFAGRRPVLVMYQPGFALFGYALGG